MIVESKATVYRSALTRRRYLTRKSAIHATARALIIKRHPTERAESENGYTIFNGWHWSQMPRSDVLFRRVVRLVANRSEAKPVTIPATQEVGK